LIDAACSGISKATISLDLFRTDYLIDVMNFVEQASRQDATTIGEAG